MDQAAYDRVRSFLSSSDVIVARELAGGGERTLAYGYTCNRDTWHAYITGTNDDAQVHVVVYDHDDTLISRRSGRALRCDVLRPDKRVYPHACDEAFALAMATRGYPLVFTTFDPERYALTATQPFHGRRLGELIAS